MAHSRQLRQATFNSQSSLLEMGALNPSGIRLEQMKEALGDQFLLSQITGTPWKTCDCSSLHVGLIVDQPITIQRIVFSAGADPAVIFSPSMIMACGRAVGVMGQLVAPEALPNFS